jgi:hypothetical protein
MPERAREHVCEKWELLISSSLRGGKAAEAIHKTKRIRWIASLVALAMTLEAI